MPEIVVRFEEKVIERVVAEKQRLTIGRTTDNDIVLDNRGVSRRHAMIEMGPSGQAVIIDNESLNGTFVNQRVLCVQLCHFILLQILAPQAPALSCRDSA